MQEGNSSEQADCVVVVQQEGKIQTLLGDYLRMFLSYRYGLEWIATKDVLDGAIQVKSLGDKVKASIVIQNREVDSEQTFSALNRGGAIPLFCLVPIRLLDVYINLCVELRNIYFWDWESAFSKTAESVLSIVERTLAKSGIEGLLEGIEDEPYEALRERIQYQVKHLDTLPTLPEMAIKITRIVNDPEANVADLEEILAADPAVVFKLLQIMKAPAFAGVHKHQWTLREIIVRLGIKQVGAIAQQIKLMNCFVLSDDNPFDLRRFWEHAVGTALVADRLCKTQAIALDPPPSFDQYWLSALLHDIGKLVLGLFFPTHFAKVMDHIDPSSSFGRDFREAEAQMGHVGLHEEIGQLLLLQVDAGERVVQAVGNHHTGGKTPDSLSALVHLANNMCKDLGLGYSAKEKGVYSPAVLEALGLSETDVQRLQDTLGASMTQEIGAMVDSCLAPRKDD